MTLGEQLNKAEREENWREVGRLKTEITNRETWQHIGEIFEGKRNPQNGEYFKEE